MTDPLEVQTPASLTEQINWEHHQAQESARTALTHAVKAGDLLRQAKQQCAHGDWLTWVKDHCYFSDRTARVYMQLAHQRTILPETEWQRVADLPLREAVLCLQVSPPPTPHQQEKIWIAAQASAKHQLRVLSLAYKHAETIEDFTAVAKLAQDLLMDLSELKVRLERELRRLLKEIDTAPPWAQPIMKMILQGGAAGQAAMQALNDRIHALEQVQP